MKRNMKPVHKNFRKVFNITDNIQLHYWNDHEWEFLIMHNNIDEKTSYRLLTLASMLTDNFAPVGVPSKRIPEFIEICQNVFAL